jgi:hypothetical protein
MDAGSFAASERVVATAAATRNRAHERDCRAPARRPINQNPINVAAAFPPMN